MVKLSTRLNGKNNKIFNVPLPYKNFGRVVIFFLLIFNVSCETLTCEGMVNVEYDSPLLYAYSFSEIGSGQGIQVIDNFIYLYGDSKVGTVQELDMQLQKTGWQGLLLVNDEDVIPHPTGLAYHPSYPTFIGSQGAIYSIDWNLFYTDRNLTRAIQKKINAGTRTTRPEYVFYLEKWYIASAEYDPSDHQNEILLMDPFTLKEAENVDDAGVIIYRFPISRFVQDIYWDNNEQILILVQNIKLWKGWKLTTINLKVAIQENSGLASAVFKTNCILLQSELEGYTRLSDNREIFLTGDVQYNLFQPYYE